MVSEMFSCQFFCPFFLAISIKYNVIDSAIFDTRNVFTDFGLSFEFRQLLKRDIWHRSFNILYTFLDSINKNNELKVLFAANSGIEDVHILFVKIECSNYNQLALKRQYSSKAQALQLHFTGILVLKVFWKLFMYKYIISIITINDGSILVKITTL